MNCENTVKVFVCVFEIHFDVFCICISNTVKKFVFVFVFVFCNLNSICICNSNTLNCI